MGSPHFPPAGFFILHRKDSGLPRHDSGLTQSESSVHFSLSFDSGLMQLPYRSLDFSFLHSSPSWQTHAGSPHFPPIGFFILQRRDSGFPRHESAPTQSASLVHFSLSFDKLLIHFPYLSLSFAFVHSSPSAHTQVGSPH